MGRVLGADARHAAIGRLNGRGRPGGEPPGERAARMEAAAGRNGERARDRAFQHRGRPFALHRGDVGGDRHQALRIGMARRAADLLDIALLDEAAEIHDPDRIGHVLDQRQIMGDDEDR